MKRRVDFYLGLWSLVFLTAAAMLWIAEPFAPKAGAPAVPFLLRAQEAGDRLRVDWDASNPDVQRADAALLEVHDGAAFHRYPVDRKILLSGGLDYLRKSADVLLLLTLYQGGQEWRQASVRTVGPVVAAEAPPEARPSPAPRSRANRSRRR